ncbi:MAG: pantetheine-phosphate adenylyltransferase [Armatimonadota bacterium]|nr:pantetheine-phosphate adenylyltransferase [Armatimonadota bacterium]
MKAIYPGTFDPVTNGHLDVIERAAAVFGEVVVAVAVNPDKSPTFSLEERVAMVRESCRHLPNVQVASIPGLLVDFAREIGAKVIVKGLRAVSDFEFEFQMAQANRKLNPEVETVFLTTASQYSFLSSSMVKQIAELGGDVSEFLPEPVQQRFRERRARGEADDRRVRAR